MNWYYWSIWWQQYWLCQAAQLYGSPGTAFANGFSGYPSSAVAPDTASVSTGQFPNTQQQQQQWAQYVQQMGRTAVHVPPAQNANTAERQRRPEMLLRINLLRGYEVLIAPVWKRIVAELIDTVLFALVVKLYFTDVDYRVPEILFEGADEWLDIPLEELRDEITLFVFSVMMQRLVHVLMEAMLVAMFGYTPGKWLMRLRVLQGVSVQYTRTMPGYSIRVEPGVKLPFINAVLRSVFKMVVSLFVPLIIFFFVLDKGRTKYDQLFQSAVVDISTLYRPVPIVGDRVQQIQLQ